MLSDDCFLIIGTVKRNRNGSNTFMRVAVDLLRLRLFAGVAYPSDAIVTGAHTRLLKLRLPSVSKRKPRKSILTNPDDKADETGTQSKYAPTLSPSDHVHSIHVGTREGEPPEVMGGDMEVIRDDLVPLNLTYQLTHKHHISNI